MLLDFEASLQGLATSGRGAQVDQSFQRWLKLCRGCQSFSLERVSPHRKHDRIDYKARSF